MTVGRRCSDRQKNARFTLGEKNREERKAGAGTQKENEREVKREKTVKRRGGKGTKSYTRECERSESVM